jgi:hypothetical protein
MMVTEDEARNTKFCPMTMARNPDDFKEERCLGSDCMAWKFTGTVKIMGPMIDCPECNGAEKGCDFCEFTGNARETNPIGYCGMAGRG